MRGGRMFFGMLDLVIKYAEEVIRQSSDDSVLLF